MNMQQQ
jgi:hypothetical protein